MADHYYSTSPDSKSDIRTIEYEVGGRSYEFFTDHGVFSISRVDHGSDILIQTVLEDYAPEGPITFMDMGCGYGPIGIVMADQYEGSRGTLMEINERAMDLARRGAGRNNVSKRVDIIKEDMLGDRTFDMVITNPPIRAGKATIFHLYAVAFERLKTGGSFYCVIRKNQGAESSVKELARLFGNCETINRESGFHILKCVKD